MTAANILLIHEGQYHLFSIGRDTYPANLKLILSCCDELLKPGNTAPTGMNENFLRTDGSYVYLMDYDRRLARCWKNRYWNGGDTAQTLTRQMKTEIDLTEWKSQLPPTWKVGKTNDSLFNKLPVEQVQGVARAWAKVWAELEKLGEQLPTLCADQLPERMQQSLPLCPLEMPYQQPLLLDGRQANYMTRQGVWVTPVNGTGPLERRPFNKVTPGQVARLFSEWLETV